MKLSTSLRAFYEALMPMLPPQIDGEGFHPKLYKRAIERARETVDHLPACDGMSGDDYTICEVTSLGATVIDLLYRARQAGVSLP